jgi:hypothetical protein
MPCSTRFQCKWQAGILGSFAQAAPQSLATTPAIKSSWFVHHTYQHPGVNPHAHWFAGLPIKCRLNGNLLAHKKQLHCSEKNQEMRLQSTFVLYLCIYTRLLQVWDMLCIFFCGLGSNLLIRIICEFELSIILKCIMASGHVKHQRTRWEEGKETWLLVSSIHYTVRHVIHIICCPNI